MFNSSNRLVRSRSERFETDTVTVVSSARYASPGSLMATILASFDWRLRFQNAPGARTRFCSVSPVSFVSRPFVSNSFHSIE